MRCKPAYLPKPNHPELTAKPLIHTTEVTFFGPEETKESYHHNIINYKILTPNILVTLKTGFLRNILAASYFSRVHNKLRRKKHKELPN